MYCCVVVYVLYLDGSVLLYYSVCSGSGWECTAVLVCMFCVWIGVYCCIVECMHCIWMGVYCCIVVYVMHLDGNVLLYRSVCTVSGWSVLLYCSVCSVSGWECTAVL